MDHTVSIQQREGARAREREHTLDDMLDGIYQGSAKSRSSCQHLLALVAFHCCARTLIDTVQTIIYH